MKNKWIILGFAVLVGFIYYIGHIGFNVYLLGVSAIVSIYIVLDNRNPSKTLVWLLLLGINPLFGLIMYYLLGGNYGKRKKYLLKSIWEENQDKKRAQVQPYVDPSVMKVFEREYANFLKLIDNISTGTLSTENQTTLYHHGREKFNALFEAIETAKHHIHLQYYAMESDQLGERLFELLSRKASEGVEVRIIYDAVGSVDMTRSYVKRMQQAGIQTAAFGKVRFRMYANRINYRNHRKIAVIDGTIGFIGGMNIGDDYISENWRDTHMRIEGVAVIDLQRLFRNDWQFLKNEAIIDDCYFPRYTQMAGDRATAGIKIIASGPDQQIETLKTVMFSMITSAKSSISIATPYFIPDEDIYSAIKTAALSGIDVKLLVPSIPDRKLVYHASRSFYKELMEVGVSVYTYDPGFVHSKVVIIDDVFATVGTCNMDIRSFHLNFEVNAVLFDEKGIQDLTMHYKHDLKQATKIDFENFIKRPKRQKVAEAFARLASPLL